MEIAQVILALAVIFILAKVSSRIFAKLGVPGLIGEIILGILIVSIPIGDYSLFEWIASEFDPSPGSSNTVHEIVEIFSELGVIFLLFTVGLETKVTDLTSVGKAALLVAVMGVIVPFIVGYLFVTITGGNMYTSMFMGAAMVATSVGITARVIKDMKLMDAKESRIIIGAAVIDDILGMIVLAIVSGMAKTGEIDVVNILVVSLTAIFFVLAVLFVAGKIIPIIYDKIQTQRAERLLKDPNYIPPGFNMFVVAIATCLVFAYVADIAGLAMIIGAFLAGMLFAEHAWEWKLEEKFESISALFVSFFFVYVGMNVDIQVFIDDPALLGTALILIVLACLTKFVGCGLGAKIAEPHMEMSSVSIIGTGMMPRGEVGIIVALLGLGMDILSNDMYGIIVLMCIATTIIAPPILSVLFKKKYNSPYAIRDSDRL
ncbi:MAG: cation:proton antiporter [Candidatus Methanomethylophilaceae archaeon]|jgi:Kef-type K+ transport system membrane component KefB|nr:cation:proton antiporter [Candidatus Methanomethylophilaceae archaeon]